MNSEFPETRFSKIGTKLGWVFSPLLLIVLILFTLSLAEGLRFDFRNGSLERKGSIEIKDLKNALIHLNGEQKAKSPNILDFTSTSPVELKVTKDDRFDWSRTITPKPGFVKTFYPIMYPKDIDFKENEIAVNNVFNNEQANTFFYEKKFENKIQIFKYSIGKQLFGTQEKNDLFRDITELVKDQPVLPSPTVTVSPTPTPIGTDVVTAATVITFKNYSVIPSNNGKNLILIVPGVKAYILDDRGNTTALANITPKAEDYFSWSPNDSHIIYKTSEELYSIEISSNRLLVVHKSSAQEKIEVQFILESGIVYKLENENVTDLVQNSFEGNDIRKLELPNIDNIRKKNLIKAYNLLDKQGILLIQTNENIYSYSTTSLELKKFNRFKGEEVIFVDADREIVVTINDTNLNQFRYYDLDQNESKSFKVDDVDIKTKPKQAIGFNGSQNLILDYGSKLKFIDIDGSNPVSFNGVETADIVLAIKIDDQVEIIVKDNLTAAAKEEMKAKSLPDADQKYILRFEKFEN
jgi:hypothetical protein